MVKQKYLEQNWLRIESIISALEIRLQFLLGMVVLWRFDIYFEFLKIVKNSLSLRNSK